VTHEVNAPLGGVVLEVGQRRLAHPGGTPQAGERLANQG